LTLGLFKEKTRIRKQILHMEPRVEAAR